jgi:hypothetical protein
MATGGRKTQLQVVHEISKQFGFGQVEGVIGVLPAGAILNITHVLTSQVWNSTTATLSIGTTPGGTQLINATSIQAAVARVDTAAPAASAGPFGVDTPIYGSIATTGPAPTQGVATVWIDYLPGPG